MIAQLDVRQRVGAFFFSESSDQWLTILRIGLGLQIVSYSLSLRADWSALFAEKSNAFVSRGLTEAILDIENPWTPRIGWLVSFAQWFGLPEQGALSILWALLFASGACLLIGLFSRSAAVLGWLLHLSAAKSADFAAYGVDNLMTIGLFYLAVAPLPDSRALDAKLRMRAQPAAARLGFHRRVLQLHLCVIYFFSGLTKTIGAGWWNGTSIWRALTRAPFNVLPVELIASWKWALPLAGVAVCIIESGYAIFIWPRKTRLVWLASAIMMHVAIGLTMGLRLFSLVMVVLNLAAFAPELSPTTLRRSLSQGMILRYIRGRRAGAK